MKKFGVFLSVTACAVAIFVLLLGIRGSIWGVQGSLLATTLLFTLPVILIYGLAKVSRIVSRMTESHYKILLYTMILLSTVVSVVVLLSVVARNIGWDPGALFDFSRGYLSGDSDSLQSLKLYLTKYSNNTLLATGIVLITQVANLIHIDPYILAGVINSTLLLTSTLLIMYMSHRLFGQTGVVVSWVFSILLISSSPWVSTFYSDTLGLFFLTAIGVSILEVARAERLSYLWAVLLGLFSAVGFLVKPTIAILLIALAIAYSIVAVVKNRKIVNVVGQLSVSLFVFALVIGGFKYFIEGHIINDQKTIDAVQLSVDHFIAMGSLRGLPPYAECRSGGYCTRLINDLATRQDLDTKKERAEYHAGLLRDSVMTEFPTGYMRFALGKISNSFGDGSFGVWTEGLLNQEYIVHSGIIDFSREFLALDGKYIRISHHVWRLAWVTVLMLCIALLASEIINSIRRKGVSFLVIGFAVAVIGLAIYQVMFESRARYIFLYLPMFILLATWGVVELDRMASRKTRSRSSSD